LIVARSGSVLITGAGRGIGLEFARQYAETGWQVHATCREPKSASELLTLPGEVTVHKLDVTHPKQIGHLQRELEGVPIDLLINNAGVIGPRERSIGNMDYDAWEEVLRINTLAPIRIAEAFLDNVLASDKKLIVSITSVYGSIGSNNSGGSYVYRSSKAALNAAMRSLAIDLQDEGVTVVVFHPGWVRTDMGGPNATVTPQDSVAGMRALIDLLKPSQSGHFYGYDGAEIPW
jgi:NAD(P)-dependent dehydrogenase (short-subunit alcohol dehydrogenase family)